MLWKSKPVNNSGTRDQHSPVMTSCYVSGREEWLERYGSYIQRARQWRMATIIALFITGVSVVGNVVQATQSKVVPYVVEVDQLGRIAAVERASVAAPMPTRVVQASLSEFVTQWRSVTADLDLQKRFIERLSFFVAGAARGQMKQWYELNNPYDRAKDKLVQVNIKSLPAQVSADSWRVEWTEVTRNHSGVQIGAEGFQATLTIQIQPPTTDTQILRNPGGVYITSMSSSSLMEPSSTPKK